MSILTSRSVAVLYVTCLHRGVGEPESELLQALGVDGVENFHKQRIAQQQGVIKILLAELPPGFKLGAPASEAIFNKYGRQWTNVPQVGYQLLAMGVAINAVQILDGSRARSSEAEDVLVRVDA